MRLRRCTHAIVAYEGWKGDPHDIRQGSVDDAALALLVLTLHDGDRAWKGFDWSVLGRSHDKGMIDDPIGKEKSVVFTKEGLARAKELFAEMFEKK